MNANEPVAWISNMTLQNLQMPFLSQVTHRISVKANTMDEFNIPLYTHPADLTDEEIDSIANDLTCTADKNWNVLFARAILRKAQEK